MKALLKSNALQSMLIALSMCICVSQNVCASNVLSNDDPQNIEVVKNPDVAPSFEGGQKALMTAIAGALKYPELYKKYSSSARVIFSLLILADGSVGDVDVKNVAMLRFDKDLVEADFSAGVIDEAAKAKIMSGECFADAVKAAAKKLPKWKAAVDDGKSVNAYSPLFPISFQPKK